MSATLVRRSSCCKQTRVGRASGRSYAVKVVAFRDTHRAQQLADAAREFASELGRGSGRPWEELVDSGVMTTLQEPRKHTKLMGIDAFEKLLGEKQPCGLVDAAQCSLLISAVNEDTDTCFLLLGPARVDNALAKEDKVQFHLLKLDFMYDDTVRRITSITHRCTMHASPALPLHHATLQQGGRPAVDEARVHKMAHAWCSAATSGQDPDKVLGPMISPGFQLWDAYGLMAQAAAGAKGNTMPAGAATGMPAMMSAEQTMVMLRRMQQCGGAGMATETRLMDYAGSLTHNAAFCHWIAMAAPTAARGGAKSMGAKQAAETMVGEGMQVMLFNDAGKISDIWSFADAMPF